MPSGWVTSVLEWAVGLFLKQVTAEDVKKVVSEMFQLLDQAVQAADKKVSGPFKGVADEVAVAFHDAVVAIVKALKD